VRRSNEFLCHKQNLPLGFSDTWQFDEALT
jgi:hypothetical protein